MPPCSSATSGPFEAAPALMASPIRLLAALRSAFRPSLSPSSARRRASSSSARSTSAGSSPLSMAPWRMTSGSSRSRCSPTLMPHHPLGPRRPLPAASTRTKSNGTGSRAASRPAGRLVGRRTLDRWPRTRGRREDRPTLGDSEDERLPGIARGRPSSSPTLSARASRYEPLRLVEVARPRPAGRRGRGSRPGPGA